MKQNRFRLQAASKSIAASIPKWPNRPYAHSQARAKRLCGFATLQSRQKKRKEKEKGEKFTVYVISRLRWHLARQSLAVQLCGLPQQPAGPGAVSSNKVRYSARLIDFPCSGEHRATNDCSIFPPLFKISSAYWAFSPWWTDYAQHLQCRRVIWYPRDCVVLRWITSLSGL